MRHRSIGDRHVRLPPRSAVAGFVFTTAIVGVDPNPHRASFVLRSTVLVVFIAAHSILAKWLYAHPAPGVAPADARVGAQLMYYGGDIVDVSAGTAPLGTRHECRTTEPDLVHPGRVVRHG